MQIAKISPVQSGNSSTEASFGASISNFHTFPISKSQLHCSQLPRSFSASCRINDLQDRWHPDFGMAQVCGNWNCAETMLLRRRWVRSLRIASWPRPFTTRLLFEKKKLMSSANSNIYCMYIYVRACYYNICIYIYSCVYIYNIYICIHICVCKYLRMPLERCWNPLETNSRRSSVARWNSRHGRSVKSTEDARFPLPIGRGEKNRNHMEPPKMAGKKTGFLDFVSRISRTQCSRYCNWRNDEIEQG